jgi:F-type H+-transporting ATPase subunit beta
MSSMPSNSNIAGAQPQEAIGTITEIHGPVVVIDCDQLPPLRQALRARLDHESYLFEVHQHINEHSLRAIALHHSGGPYRGMTVYDNRGGRQITHPA